MFDRRNEPGKRVDSLSAHVAGRRAADTPALPANIPPFIDGRATLYRQAANVFSTVMKPDRSAVTTGGADHCRDDPLIHRQSYRLHYYCC